MVGIFNFFIKVSILSVPLFEKGNGNINSDGGVDKGWLPKN